MRPRSGQSPDGRRPASTPPAAGSGGRAEGQTDGGAYRWGRKVEGDEARERGEQASRRRRSFRPQRSDLDAPLPEDVAFRSGAEGGDRSILPARRRRPTGMRDTDRILVGGARTVGNWVPRGDTFSAPPLSPPVPVEPALDQPLRLEPADMDDDDLDGVSPAADAGAVDGDEPTEDAEGAPKRRRRGRRGGRGRRRSDGAVAEDGSPVPHDDDLHDDLDDEDEDEEDDAVALAPVVVTQDEPVAEEEPVREEREERVERPTTVRRSRRAPAPVAIERVEEPEADDERDEYAPVREPRQGVAPIDPSMYPAAFANLGLGERALSSLARFGFASPTPIQEQAIPALMNGLDVVGIAQTGSGKTIAFGAPMVEKLDPDLAEVQAIILVPTRELAQQVLDVLSDLARPCGLEAVGLLGGHSLQRDFRALDARPHIVVGTPGRILDHLGRGTLTLRYVRYAVLDEADQMLDIGFLPDIRRILSRTPQRRQTALFSATMPGTIRRLIWQFMNDPETISVAAESTTVESVAQVYMEVASRDKVRAIRELVDRELRGRTLIFCNMKRRVDNLEHDLARDGVRVGALHGDMDQRQRDRVVQQFREGALDVLIATNVAARGLDIPEITHVVNYDVPQNPEEYVHRIGRTGRAGREGKAITFVSEWDMDAFDAIYDKFSDRLQKEDLDLYRPSPPPAARTDEATS
ncbi:MAG: DEAD/DEAH box helicase [Dehalococcoidia bacterium]|nr:DEAD/DEAH box helicase [Dehalococcoidia bacterium]